MDDQADVERRVADLMATLDRPRLREGLAYWGSKRAGRRMPERRDIDPGEIPALLPWVMLVDVLRDPPDFRYRLIGTGVAARSARDHTGRLFSELPQIDRGGDLWREREAVVQGRLPRLARPPYVGDRVRSGRVSALYLPLSTGGEGVGMIMSIVEYDDERLL